MSIQTCRFLRLSIACWSVTLVVKLMITTKARISAVAEGPRDAILETVRNVAQMSVELHLKCHAADV